MSIHIRVHPHQHVYMHMDVAYIHTHTHTHRCMRAHGYRICLFDVIAWLNRLVSDLLIPSILSCPLFIRPVRMKILARSRRLSRSLHPSVSLSLSLSLSLSFLSLSRRAVSALFIPSSPNVRIGACTIHIDMFNHAYVHCTRTRKQT